jgi:hypothetical protein
MAFPGNPEVCDGVDNDCNGSVDDGFFYLPDDNVSEVAVSSDAQFAAEPSGLAWDGTKYLAYYEAGPTDSVHVWTAFVSDSATVVGSETPVSNTVADSHGGTIHGQQAVWTGDRFGLTWNDTRDGNYEIYFAALDSERRKLPPGDVRVTNDDDSSFNPTIAWTGTEFVIIWEAGRGTATRIHGQRVGLDGHLHGSNTRITVSAPSHDRPFVAVGANGFGVAAHVADSDAVEFIALDRDLTHPTSPILLTPEGGHGDFPRIVYSSSNYVVAWHDSVSTKRAIWASVVSETGQIVVPAAMVTESPLHSRYPTLVTLGDRLSLTWADDKDENQGYELYTKMLSSDLAALTAEMRITNAAADSILPIATLGSTGAGILFRDDRFGTQQVWFAALRCGSQ